MGKVAYLTDRLVNFVANLGTERDKSSSSFYAPPVVNDIELTNAYRGAWMPRKIVDIPARDAVRKWRAWQAQGDQIEAVEAEEKRLQVRQRILEAMTKGRLFGGAAVFIGTGDLDPSQPLDPARIKKQGVQYLTVLNRRQLKPGDRDLDVQSPRFGKPRWYDLAGTIGPAVRIDPSRLVLFCGNPLPDDEMNIGSEWGWGDSVLTAVMDAIRQAESTLGNVASLIFEAKVDVFQIPGFMAGMGDPEYVRQVQERVRLAAMAKGINGMLLMDAEEKYDQKSANFGGLPDLIDRALQVVSGAADIPATRLLSQSPAGMSATGESDLRNYYDGISSIQELDLQPAMMVLDECLIRSALGSRPPEVHYIWNSLWQTTATERAAISKTTADTIKVLADSRIIPEEALSAAAVTLLTENGVMPGLEAAIEEFGSEVADDEGDGDPIGAPVGRDKPVTDSDLRRALMDKINGVK